MVPTCYLGPLHTWDWEPVTIILQALSLVEKVEPGSKFASHCAWGSNWVCECKMDVTWIPTWHPMNYVSWSLGLYSQTTSCMSTYHKTRRPWHFEHSQLLIYSILACMRTRMNGHSLTWHLVESMIAYDFTLHLRVRDHTRWCLEVCWDGLWTPTFLCALRIAWSRLLALCVKWPLHWLSMASTPGGIKSLKFLQCLSIEEDMRVCHENREHAMVYITEACI